MLSICDIDEGLQSIAGDCSSEEDASALLERYYPIRETLNIERLDYCISKYLEAEFDTKTEGVRGLGRTTESVPRLGGYYRKEFSKLGPNTIEELKVVTREILLRGYLVHLMSIDQGNASLSSPAKEEVYKKWIPRIYITGFEEFPELLQNVFLTFTEDPMERFFRILRKNGIEQRVGFFKKDLTVPILVYYAIAGFGLRTIEVGR